MKQNKDSQIEFINEKELDFLGGANENFQKDDKVCGNLRECGWNNDVCPKLERCDWN